MVIATVYNISLATVISVISITKAGASSGASSTLTNYNCKNEMKMSLHFKEPLPTTMSHHTCFRADWRKWTVSASTNSSFLLSMTMLDMMRPSQEKKSRAKWIRMDGLKMHHIIGTLWTFYWMDVSITKWKVVHTWHKHCTCINKIYILWLVTDTT